MRVMQLLVRLSALAVSSWVGHQSSMMVQGGDGDRDGNGRRTEVHCEAEGCDVRGTAEPLRLVSVSGGCLDRAPATCVGLGIDVW